ncbi:hypothetical protein A5819_000947 [Enterococcus sp. 7E2_DIV0204]|nr:hypothetical protein A5819_000947 [Enterococcus sp. 7E2_DIV0204]OTP50935.1 hypothetical protein A5884_000121 [Enterococcus sp. 7D2_DIV0200]
MKASSSFTKTIAKGLLPYLFHHDPGMENNQATKIGDGD